MVKKKALNENAPTDSNIGDSFGIVKQVNVYVTLFKSGFVGRVAYAIPSHAVPEQNRHKWKKKKSDVYCIRSIAIKQIVFVLFWQNEV